MYSPSIVQLPPKPQSFWKISVGILKEAFARFYFTPSCCRWYSRKVQNKERSFHGMNVGSFRNRSRPLILLPVLSTLKNFCVSSTLTFCSGSNRKLRVRWGNYSGWIGMCFLSHVWYQLLSSAVLSVSFPEKETLLFFIVWNAFS